MVLIHTGRTSPEMRLGSPRYRSLGALQLGNAGAGILGGFNPAIPIGLSPKGSLSARVSTGSMGGISRPREPLLVPHPFLRPPSSLAYREPPLPPLPPTSGSLPVPNANQHSNEPDESSDHHRAWYGADEDERELHVRHQEHQLSSEVESDLERKRQLLADRQVLHLCRRRAMKEPLATASHRPSAFPALAAGGSSGEKYKLLAYESVLSMCNHYEERLHRQHATMLKMENKCWINTSLETQIEGLQAELAETIQDKDRQIEQLKKDLETGKPVLMAPAAKGAIDEALAGTLAALQASAASPLSPEEEEGLAAMPGWSLEKWLDSLPVKAIVSSSILNHIRGAGAEVNSQVELRFMQQLGKSGDQNTVLAMLRQSTVINELASALWSGIRQLTNDLEEEAKSVKTRGQPGASNDSSDLKTREAQAEELEAMAANAEASRQQLKVERASAREHESAARRKAIDGLHEKVEDGKSMVAQLRNELNDAKAGNAPAEHIAAIQEQMDSTLELAAQAQADAEIAAEEERQRVEAEERKESEAARQDDIQREKEKAAIQTARADVKAAISELAQSENVRHLSYAPSSVYFAGLSTIVGRCGAEPGDENLLLKLMENEHVRIPCGMRTNVLHSCAVQRLMP